MVWGSSPLARGLRRRDARAHPQARIIPARAGFTGSPIRRPASRRDHPRSRGVYQSAWASPIPPRGSSPLARGLRIKGRLQIASIGIIPARAGFTAAPVSARRAARDHPRSRGVYGSRPPARRAASGSSPLARGLRLASTRTGPTRRIIPARAGFTTAPRASRLSSGDHPRSRGVYRNMPPGIDVRYRIIPARAGFTPRRPKDEANP